LNSGWSKVAFATLEDITELGEDLIVYIIERILDQNQKELEVLERDTKPLELVKKPFPRLTYDEAQKMLKKKRIQNGMG
jgi:asparaginyl-tRNA synthetase